VAALVDTNVLVYCFDPRFPEQQRRETEWLRRGIEEDDFRLPRQAVVEFVAAATRPLPDGALLSLEEALREAEDLLSQFEILYPSEGLVRTAVRGCALYQLSWFDAHFWAHAEHYGLSTLYSEDFQHDRLYGTVRVLDPFQV
jgi:predicted nucleic acid-binding protein